ncbi:MAG: FTR1 family protein [Gammaproteobacteria bacterium]|jgi:high-affinity iron transporter|nr:FTR1 family protein [Gammaproteobacteria bacterium]MBP6051010.1 FTR1 family protein [Pseudomonadales bacterium]MBK6582517.1 FTR1 family protein [Gammaproteobacteria bacterium]MBK7169662.1 FTR1 family protein [Gammaproteobacteria bacterium]MBK7521215.1 FTR1 family protein [Gammaproteobacteria bacterium]
MGNVVFIVWRESVEAMLVIGILYAWLRGREEAAQGRRFLWGGVLAGLGLALGLAGIMFKMQSELAGVTLDYFQIGIILAAAALIVQMVLWMRQHGRTLKRELESGMERATEEANWWAMATLAALAVGREGAETVVFLYGAGMARSGMDQIQFAADALLGFALALLTFWLLSRSSRFLSWKVFFRFSEIVLLLLASALLVDGIDRMIGMGWLPPLVDPAWDSTFLLDDSTRFGGLVASLTGYRARPALLLLLVDAAYWIMIVVMLRRTSVVRRDACASPPLP